MIELALNPASALAEERLVDHIKVAGEQNWYALIDTAFDYEKRAFPLPANSVIVYQGIGFDELQPVSPVLVPINRKDVANNIRTLFAHCSGKPMLSFVATSQDIDAKKLVKQWLPLHRAITADGQKLLMRFADIRILSHLPRTLKPEQWAAWHQNINEWHYINRRGDLERLSPPKAEVKPAREMRIDDEQFAKMLEATEADANLNIIIEYQPQSIPEHLSGLQAYQFAELSLITLRQYGIHSTPDSVAFTVGVINTDGALLRAPQLHAFLSAKQWESGKLGAVLAEEPWIQPLFQPLPGSGGNYA